MIALVPDSVLATLNSVEILGIIYLAIAVSKLRSDIARIEGRMEERRERLHDRT